MIESIFSCHLTLYRLNKDKDFVLTIRRRNEFVSDALEINLKQGDLLRLKDLIEQMLAEEGI